MAKKEVKLDAKGFPKFGIRDKLAYAAGDAACNLSFGLKTTVQTFWLVYMMMETGLFSLLLLAVQIWDAVNDPLIGSLIDSDRRKYKLGKYKTYILIGACGLLVGGAAVFLPFPNASVVVKAMLFIVGYVIWDAAYTMANVPYGTMLNIVTENNEERASLSVFRSIAGLIGGAILCVFPLCPKNLQLIVYMVGLIFFGLGMGFYNCVSWAMMGDAIDYQEWKFGKREESVVYALHSFFRKLAQGVGPAAVIAIMGTPLIGYISSLGTIGQSAETAKNMCWLVAILYTFSAVCQFVGVAIVYNIDRKTLAKMQSDLAERRAVQE